MPSSIDGLPVNTLMLASSKVGVILPSVVLSVDLYFNSTPCKSVGRLGIGCPFVAVSQVCPSSVLVSTVIEVLVGVVSCQLIVLPPSSTAGDKSKGSLMR